MRRLGIFGALALSLMACRSEVPTAQYFPMTHQPLMASAAHWQILAAQTAKDLKIRMPLGISRIYLQRDDDSSFSTTFDDLLATELVHRGIYVSNNPSESYVVAINVDVIKHNHFPVAGPVDATLLGTISGTAVWLGEKGASVPGAAIPFIGLGAGALLDAQRQFDPAATNTEVVISTTLSYGALEVAANSDIFYIENADANEYDQGLPSRPLRVVGG